MRAILPPWTHAVESLHALLADVVDPQIDAEGEIPDAARVLIGPAEIAFTRMFRGPRSAAR